MGLNGIKLNDLNSRLKLIFRQGRMFGILFLNRKMSPHRTFEQGFISNVSETRRTFKQQLKFIYYFNIFKKIILGFQLKNQQQKYIFIKWYLVTYYVLFIIIYQQYNLALPAPPPSLRTQEVWGLAIIAAFKARLLCKLHDAQVRKIFFNLLIFGIFLLLPKRNSLSLAAIHL